MFPWICVFFLFILFHFSKNMETTIEKKVYNSVEYNALMFLHGFIYGEKWFHRKFGSFISRGGNDEPLTQVELKKRLLIDGTSMFGIVQFHEKFCEYVECVEFPTEMANILNALKHTPDGYYYCISPKINKQGKFLKKKRFNLI